MKNFNPFLFIIFPFLCFSQRQYSKEFSFVNDNDLFVSIYHDRYYTNGTFFKYRFLGNDSNEKVIKKIYNFELGHKMFTPYLASVQFVEHHDRPFAGYLYGGFGIHQFFSDHSFLKNAVEIGVIGSNSFARELQNFVHSFYGFREAIGWKYQIRNAFALNFKSSYGRPIIQNSSKYLDLNWVSDANFGTVLMNVATGLYSRIGFKPLQKNSNTIAFNSNLNKKDADFSNEKEVFFFIKPQISYVLYDATIEGSFLNLGSPITYAVIPFVFTSEFGIRFTSGRFNFGYVVNYHTRKLKSIRVPKGNLFGTIQMNYQFN